ncbi:HEPN domain-containing protein [Nonomuraea sediminis]|uniref:ApeA N-terminal domain 1-containing protein n=1 Tax=Nonomuraea sediminis TaxID=2835864 RepID=UPI001BDBDAF2|nr:HEPN domain-containing protein [Nonomuraea sediminis]
MVPHRAFEAQGEWWLPGREGRRVAGVLRFDPDAGSELRLIGTFRGMDEEGERTERRGAVVTITYSRDSLENAGTYPRILGRAGGNSYTLEDCVRKSVRRSLTGGGGTETVNVNQIYRGANFGDSELPTANSVSVDLRYLTQWIGRPAIKESYTFLSESNPDLKAIDLKVVPLDDQTALLADGTLRLTHSIRVSGDRITGRSLAQKFYFRIDSTRVAGTQDLLERISDLQDLVSIATGRTAEIDGLRYWNSALANHERDDNAHPRPVEFFAKWNNRDTSKTPGSMRLQDIYFTFEQFGGVEGVARWLDQVERYRSALGRVVSSRYAPSMFTSDRLLSYAAALEFLDRVNHTSGVFAQRMARCATLAGSPFLALIGGDVQRWIKAVKDHRNDIAHHGGTHVKQSNSAQFFLARSLYWVFVLCILREARAPEAVFQQITKHDAFNGLGPRLRATLPPL